MKTLDNEDITVIRPCTRTLQPEDDYVQVYVEDLNGDEETDFYVRLSRETALELAETLARAANEE